MRRPWLASMAFVGSLSCAPHDAREPSSSAQEAAGGSSAAPASTTVTRPAHPLGLDEARAYGLALVNRDRAAAGLSALVIDSVASAAAQRHVRDLASHGVTAHWGSDGSTPEQRYTEAGGEDLTMENVACYADEKARSITESGPFDPAAIEASEAAFMNEKPPADGHRKNILDPLHTRGGFGFATAPGSNIVCVVQELIDDYGSYTAIPRTAREGDTLTVSGDIKAPMTFGGVGLGRAPLPAPKTPAELMATGGYQMPNPFVSYFPKGFTTPKPVDVNGAHFSLALPLTNLKGPGTYEIEIFVHAKGGGKELVPVSMRTVIVK